MAKLSPRKSIGKKLIKLAIFIFNLKFVIALIYLDSHIFYSNKLSSPNNFLSVS